MFNPSRSVYSFLNSFKRAKATNVSHQEGTNKSNKNMKKPRNQPNLLNYMMKNNSSTAISAKITHLNNGYLTQNLPEKPDEGSLFVLVLAVDRDKSDLKPVIIMVREEDIPKKDSNEITVIVRFRLNDKSFFGRMMMISVSRSKIEAELNNAFACLEGKQGEKRLKQDELTYSITKNTNITRAEINDTRTSFLATMFKPRHDETNLSQNQPAYSNISLPCTSTSSSCMNSSMKEASMSSKVHENTNLREMVDISSSDDDADGLLHKRRKRFHNYSDSKLVSKLIDEKSECTSKANVEISHAIGKLEELVPTLQPSSSLTPIIKNLYILTKNINLKMNSQDSSLTEAKLPFTKNVTAVRTKTNNEIKLCGKVVLPLNEYSKATMAKKPCLVVSRVIRKCFPIGIKLDCIISNDFDDSNFLWRIGGACLEKDERVKAGQEILDIIIEHAHILKNHDSMTLSSYRECMYQVSKALYDCNRRYQQQLGAMNRKNQEIDESQVHGHSKNDYQDLMHNDYQIRDEPEKPINNDKDLESNTKASENLTNQSSNDAWAESIGHLQAQKDEMNLLDHIQDTTLSRLASDSVVRLF